MLAAQDVGHHRPRRPGARVAQRQVEHGPQVLLELAGDGAVHRPVAAVVRPHGQLVDEVCGCGALARLGAGTSNISTASTPVTPSSPAIRRPVAVAAAASAGSIPGAGASTSVQIPSVCTVSTTGHAAAWPEGLRATRTASSRPNATRSSRSTPSASGPGRPSLGEPVRQVRGAGARRGRPCRRSRRAGVLATTGQPDRRRRRSSTSAPTVRRRPPRARDARSRPAARAWPACPGRTSAPPARGAARRRRPPAPRARPAGTCSWSKVTTSQRRANARTVSRSVCEPTGDDGTTRAADASVGLGEDAQLDAELDGRALHHPGQLAAADHADHREPAGGAPRRARGVDGSGGRSRQASLVRGRLRPSVGRRLDGADGFGLYHSRRDGLPQARPHGPAARSRRHLLARGGQVRRHRRGRVRHRLRRVQPAVLRPAGGSAGDVEDHLRCRGDAVRLDRQPDVDLPAPPQPAGAPRGACCSSWSTAWAWSSRRCTSTPPTTCCTWTRASRSTSTPSSGSAWPRSSGSGRTASSSSPVSTRATRSRRRPRSPRVGGGRRGAGAPPLSPGRGRRFALSPAGRGPAARGLSGRRPPRGTARSGPAGPRPGRAGRRWTPRGPAPAPGPARCSARGRC